MSPGTAPTAVTVSGTGSYLPGIVVTNDALAPSLGVEPGWIAAKTGIHERRMAAPDEATSDLATAAARQALDAAGIDGADLGMVAVATSTADEPIPATASRVQAALGATRAAAFDLDAVCTGFVYALALVAGFMRAEPSLRYALIVGADAYSRILDYRDRKTAALFGDGAGAVVLSRNDDADHGVRGTALGADGSLAHLVQIPAGGSRLPASPATVAGGQHHFKMLGREVRDFAHEVFPRIVKTTLDAAGLALADVDLIVPHQANGVILRECGDALGVPPDRLHLTVGRYGNTGAASVPITLDDAVRRGRVAPGAIVLLAAFGGGMTWGGAVLRWEDGS